MENPLAKCMQMCPASERAKRESNRLIHVLETKPWSVTANRNRRADSDRMVKRYSRSAAGQMLTNPELLRPIAVLSRTVKHLLTEVIKDDRVSSLAKYDFINDRLRSVKQDGIIQRLAFQDWFRILPSLVRFYAFSAYWYCEEPAENFDQKLNKDRLVDCLSLYIAIYEDAEEFSQTNAEMEALHLLVNNDRIEMINRSVLLNLKESVFKDALKMILEWHGKKYTSVIRSFVKLSLPLACLFAALHLKTVRKYVLARYRSTNNHSKPSQQSLQIMSHAYSCKNQSYPLDTLKTNLSFNSDQEVIDECGFYEIPVSPENNTVQFRKILLKQEMAPSKKLNELDEKLSGQSIPYLLLG